jgi:hypothetical protein
MARYSTAPNEVMMERQYRECPYLGLSARAAISDSDAPTDTDNRTRIGYCSQISGLTCGAPQALTQRASLFSKEIFWRAQALTRRAALALGRRAAWVSRVFAGRRTSINSARRAVF